MSSATRLLNAFRHHRSCRNGIVIQSALEAPTKFELVINIKPLTPTLLARADEVIE
jgi:hypothetical protein